MKPPKITTVPRREASTLDFSPPSKFYYVNALFDLVFVHRVKRKDAQEWVDTSHGKGKYNIRLARYMKNKKN